jgi:protoporphyrinogen oxidase
MYADVVIVGGGMTGLGTAHHLNVEACLFEKEPAVGGCLRSDYKQGYTIDRTGHLLHFRDPYVRRLMFEQLPIDWLHFRRNAEIHILDRRVPYPIQYHLHALPDEARVQCLMSYIDTLGQQPTLQDSFDCWSRLSYGDGLHELFFAPYNQKLWQTELDSINAEWAEKFVPMPERELVVRGALGCHTATSFGYNAVFSYPRRGGSRIIAEALAAQTQTPIYTNVELVAVDPCARICEFSDGSRVRYRALVSTLPLPRLLRCLRPVEPAVLEMAERLRHNSVFYFALGYRTGGESPSPHWIYVPEPHFFMYRVGVLSNYSPEVAPAGSTLLCAEIGFPGDTAMRCDPSAIRDRVLADLHAIRLVQPGWTLEFEHHGAIDCAYVIFDEARRQALPKILGYLERQGIYSIGRYGAWGYGSMSDALIEGRHSAERLNEMFGSSRS